MCVPRHDLEPKPRQGAFHKRFVYCQGELLRHRRVKHAFSRGSHRAAEQELGLNVCRGRGVDSSWLSCGIKTSEMKTKGRRRDLKVSDEMIPDER